MEDIDVENMSALEAKEVGGMALDLFEKCVRRLEELDKGVAHENNATVKML